MGVVRGLVESHLARHAGRAPRLPGRNESENPVFCHEKPLIRGRRRGFPTVINHCLATLAIMDQHEGPAAKPGALRLDQAEDGMNRDRRIDGMSALAQHVEPGLNSARVSSRHHATMRPVFDAGSRRRGRLASVRCRGARTSRKRYGQSQTDHAPKK